jgi:hypothetical protein
MSGCACAETSGVGWRSRGLGRRAPSCGRERRQSLNSPGGVKLALERDLDIGFCRASIAARMPF